MKKTVAVTMGALLLLLSIGIAGTCYAKDTAARLEGYLDHVLSCIKRQDFDEAQTAICDLIGLWEEREGMMQLFSVHEDIDRVDEIRDSLFCAIEERDRIHILMEGARMRHAVRHLYHRDAPDMTNIF
jgi:hypothetical protein